MDTFTDEPDWLENADSVRMRIIYNGFSSVFSGNKKIFRDRIAPSGTVVQETAGTHVKRNTTVTLKTSISDASRDSILKSGDNDAMKFHWLFSSSATFPGKGSGTGEDSSGAVSGYTGSPKDDISKNVSTTQMSAGGSNTYMYWWVEGGDIYGNAYSGSATLSSPIQLFYNVNVKLLATDLKTGSFEVGQTNEPFLQIKAVSNIDTVTVTGITFTHSGTATTSDVDRFILWNDADESKTVTGGDVGLDTVVASSSLDPAFSGFTIKAPTDTAYMLLTVDIASGATPTNTLGMKINSQGNVTVASSADTVQNNFPQPSSTTDHSLPVELFSFSADGVEHGILLKWITQSEIGNLGFNIYRSNQKDKIIEKINTYLIPGAMDSPSRNDYSYFDKNVKKDMTYWYQLEDVSYKGIRTRHEPISIHYTNIPIGYRLYQNYPNPFNPTTTIRYDIPETGEVKLKIYNILGKEIITLVKGFKEKGSYNVYWDGRNRLGENVSSGVYFYKMEINTFTYIRKMVLLR